MFVFYGCPSGTLPDYDLETQPRETCDPNAVLDDGYHWSLLIALCAIGEIVGGWLRGWGFGTPGARITTELRKKFYDAIVRQEIGWHDLPENASGKLCAALASEVELIQALTGEQVCYL
jgi:hypothetical protein